MHNIRDGYKSTPIGDLPNDWDVEKLENICGILDTMRKPLKESDREKIRGDIPYYGATGIIDWVNDFIFDEDIILLGEDGENLRSRNRPLAFRVRGKCWVNNHAHVFNIINPQTDHIDFITYVLEAKDYSTYIVGSAQPKITQAQCRSFFLQRPSFVEQKKIADILSTVDKQIEQTDALIEKTKELKKGLIQRLLTKGIGHTEFRDTEIGRIPKGWKVKRLCEVSDINPESLSNKTDSSFTFKYIDIECVTTGKINETKEYCFAEAPSRARRIVLYNDVIISTVRPYLKAFAVVKNHEENMICSTGFAVIRALNDNNPDFIFQFTLSDCFLNQMTNKMMGSNYPAVNASDVKESLIAVPPIGEQANIALILCSVDKQIVEYESKRARLNILKSGLMQQLLMGKIRVTV